MTLIDNLGIKYKTIKTNNNYYLIHERYDKYKNNKKTVQIIVKGKQNVLTFIKNNGLKKVEEMFEFLY